VYNILKFRRTCILKSNYNFDYSMKTKPYPHQVDAIEYIKGKNNISLFDEQGLGKTKIVIDALVSNIQEQVIDGAIVICKKNLIQTWHDEIKKHSHLSSIVLRGTEKEKGYKFLSYSHFYLINYEYLETEFERINDFLQIRRFAMVLDESHTIKNPDTQAAKNIFKLRSHVKKRIIITGTPIANKPEDIWSQYYFLDGGETLGTDYYSFKKKYGNLNYRNKLSESEIQTIEELRHKIEETSIRRRKDDVLELPEKKYIDIYTDLTGEQKDIYDKVKSELLLEIIQISGEVFFEQLDMILTRLLRLTQIASNPRLIDTNYSQIPCKFVEVDRLVSKLKDNNEKGIIWTSFVGNILELHERYINDRPLVIYGDIPLEKRNRYIYLFQNDSDYQILIANPSAAREGLTLTKANNAIYLDRNFNLVDYLQSQDRIHRISQEKECNIYKIIAKDTIDEYIDFLLYKKEDIARYIQGDGLSMKSMDTIITKEELINILGGN